MTDTPVWDKPNPVKKSKKLTSYQKAKARARAKAAGRPYPNMVDNIAVARESLEIGSKEIRVAYQRMTPGQEKADIGDDTMVPQTDKINLKRRKSIKRFKAYFDEEKEPALNKPHRTPGGPKKFSVYVKNEKGNTVKVNFGDPNMEIKRDNPARRKAFRARHNCDNPGPKTSAKYWSCKMWSKRNVSDLT